MIRFLALLCIGCAALAVDHNDTRLLSQPALSSTHIAFIYADDLWVADRDGGHPRRLTADDGVEGSPAFSPDGEWIAFTGEYDGNRDVYIIPSEGGSPTRLTFHPGRDTVFDFAPDGASVLFGSQRNSYTNRYVRLHEVAIEGGMPSPLPVPVANFARYSPSGKLIAYIPMGEAFRQWKNYRGGTAAHIWIYDRETHDVQTLPQPEGRCNDTRPAWVGDDVYFLSDRTGEFNLFRFDRTSQSVEQLTEYDDFPILALDSDGASLIFEQAGYLHLFDAQSQQTTRLKIGVAADLVEARPRYVNAGTSIRNADISPSGARAVFEARGEIFTVPAEKGPVRNLSQSAGAHERDPAWSPDGSQIAYFSDQSGEYQLVLAPQDGQGAPRRIDLEGHGFYFNPRWSPDGKWIAYRDNAQAIYLLNVASGTCRKLDQEVTYSPIITISYDWSPDSKYLAYTVNLHGLMQTVFVHDVAANSNIQITDGMSEVSNPVFDADGKFLYFLASTDAGPLKDWFAMSNDDRQWSYAIYVAVLDRETASPLAPESDEAKLAETDDTQASEPEDEAKKDDTPTTVIHAQGIENRILALPIPVGNYSNLQAGSQGRIYFLDNVPAVGFGVFGDSGALKTFNLKDKKVEDVADGVSAYTVSQDNGKVLLARGNGQTTWAISDAIKFDGKGQLNTDLQVKIEPRSEWSQIYNEAWRINRDYFYATNYHGVDWNAMHDRYAQFLPDLAVRSDLTRVIQWLCSELAVGHHRTGGGDSISDPETVPVGLLGADYEIANQHYRFKRVYGGLNWNPDLAAPLTAPGVDVHDGEYLLEVNRQPVVPPDNLYAFFENTAGVMLTLKVGPNPDGTQAREVNVVPIRDESALRNRAWVEDNIRKVDEASDGRVAYVWLPNTTTLGHTYFKRYFYPQSHKDAIILDERHNGGGQVADYYIDVLRRRPIANWATRYGDDLFTPRGSIQGPKVMLIDETAGSGGDLLPWMFRKYDMGPLIGKRTWGGLVGILGFPTLMDGGFVTAPNLAIWTKDGWVVENAGVPPDIEVEQWPKAVIEGHDPQLEKAIDVVLRKLEADPPQKPERPAYPIRNQ